MTAAEDERIESAFRLVRWGDVRGGLADGFHAGGAESAGLRANSGGVAEAGACLSAHAGWRFERLHANWARETPPLWADIALGQL